MCSRNVKIETENSDVTVPLGCRQIRHCHPSSVYRWGNWGLQMFNDLPSWLICQSWESRNHENEVAFLAVLYKADLLGDKWGLSSIPSYWFAPCLYLSCRVVAVHHRFGRFRVWNVFHHLQILSQSKINTFHYFSNLKIQIFSWVSWLFC